MTNSELQQRLTAWAGNRTDATSAFVNRLAEALGSPPSQKLWAFVDIRREFESLIGEPEDLASTSVWVRVRGYVRNILPVLYVAPILVTWSELALAVSSYRQAVRKNPGETVDFLAVWAKVDGEHTGLGFQAAAIVIAVAISLIVLAHFVGMFATHRIHRIGQSRFAELNPLLLDSQLVLVKSRAVTPEEMADSLTAAAGVLQDALAEVSGVLPRFETISTRLDEVVSGLATASQSLDSTSRIIGAAADSLNDLPARATPLIRALGEAPGALQDMLEVFARTSEEANRVNRSIVDAGAKLTDESARVARAVADVGRQLSDLVRQVEGASAVVADIPVALAEPAKVARELAQGLESAAPVALVFRDGSEQIRESVKALAEMVKELKYAADQYKAVNDQHGRQN
jgi:methyl-accepting chemotaxis protein